MPSLASTARSLILLQLLSRVLTFTLNQLLVRVASPSVFGTAAVQFDLVLSTILFLSREGVRLTALRAPRHDGKTSEAQISNLSLLPLPLSFIVSAVLIPLYLGSMPESTTAQPSFYPSLAAYVVAAVAELAIEPLFNSAQRNGQVDVRVRAEGVAVIVRAIITVVLVGFGGEKWALLGFAAGQLGYAVCLVGRFCWEYRGSLSTVYVDKSTVNSTWLNSALVKRATYQSLQSVLKHLLTEADRIVVALACTLGDQGGWAVVVGYGSLITRIIFQPMEESTLLYFSRSLADIRDVSSKDKRSSLRPAAVYLRTLLQFSTHLLLLLPSFLPPLLPSLLPFILPSQYLKAGSTASSTLVTYLSVYIPLLSLNGILEAFFAATAKPEDLAAQSRAMLIGSAAFAATLFGLTRPECATYLAQVGYSDFMTTEKALIFANASQMLVRITFAQRHAKRFFSSIQGITKANTCPDLRTAAVIIACGAALRGAEVQYVQGRSDWETKAVFVGGGGLLGIACLATAYFFTFRQLLTEAQVSMLEPMSGKESQAEKPSEQAVVRDAHSLPPFLQRVRERIAARRAGIALEADPSNPSQDARTFAAAIKRRRKLTGALYKYSSFLRAVLIIIGLAWLLLLPADVLRKRSYVDEHALSPGGVTTYFDWSDVHQADIYLGDIEELWQSEASSQIRSEYLIDTLAKAGVPAAGLQYAFSTSNGTVSGVTTYAHISPPRSPGTETILISANWLSLQSGPNLRGVALLLALARFLRGQNHWAFDFALVFGDGYLDGIQAFLSSYHGVEQSNLQVGPLDLPLAGNIWTALNVDYPGHSFSHLGLYYEGVNGRLPNQDILNAVTYVSRWTGGVPVRLHNIDEDHSSLLLPQWLEFLETEVRNYLKGLAHIKDHFGYAAFGRPSGAHGVFAKYRIDAITLFASPADGPHGFHALGRTLEASMRSLNNLLERLHASYFFYILPSPDTFLPVGQYLPAIIMIGIGITVGGLAQWVQAGWVADPNGKWSRRPRPILLSLALMAGAFAQGITFWCLDRSSWTSMAAGGEFGHLWTMSAFPVAFVLLSDTYMDAALCPTLSAFTHLIIGALASALAMVNFPQACLLVALLLPVLLAPHLTKITDRVWPALQAFKAPLVLSMSPVALVMVTLKSHPQLWSTLIEEYEVLGNLALPSIYLVWWPLWQLGVMIALLSPSAASLLYK